MSKQIAENSVTIVKTDPDLIPIDQGKFQKTLLIDLTNRKEMRDAYFSQIFHENFSVYSHIVLKNESENPDYRFALDLAKDCDLIIIPCYFYVKSGSNGNLISDIQLRFLKQLIALNKKIIIISFENPYLLSVFPEVENYICTYSDTKSSQRAVLNVLSGSVKSTGRLPVTIPNTQFKLGYRWNPGS